MKFFILIVMLFSPPRLTEDALIVTAPPNDEIVSFDSYEQCYIYVHEHLSDLFQVAWNTYPSATGIRGVYCRVAPNEEEEKEEPKEQKKDEVNI